MVVFPNVKINLGLRVKSKRDDGFHELDTVFFPLPICDVLEVVVQENNSTGLPVNFMSSGLHIPGNSSQNLCIKAYELLRNDFPHIPSINMHLHKNIPMGAGLGGGSSDGAFTIRLLNEKFNLGLNDEQMIGYALQLGSDCPFFILNKPISAGGRGEKMSPVDCDLSNFQILVVHPGLHVSTAEAFRKITLHPTAPSCADVLKKPAEEWKYNLINDFEEAVFPLFPELKNIKSRLYDNGAVYASMTGSGSTFFGLFQEIPDLKGSFPPHYTCFKIANGLSEQVQ